MYVGASNTSVYSIVATLPFTSAGSYIQYNNVTTGTLVSGTNNRYYNVYQILIPTATDANSAKYRMIMLQPQQEFTSLVAAQNEDPKGLNLGALMAASPELVLYSRITYVTASGNANTGKCRISDITYLSGNKVSLTSVSGVIPNNHAGLSNLT
jgi:hypothetical protein